MLKKAVEFNIFVSTSDLTTVTEEKLIKGNNRKFLAKPSKKNEHLIVTDMVLSQLNST